MILPIVAYGHPVLKKKAEDITPEYPNFKAMVSSMFKTMYNANGVGLAAPQVGLSIRVFVVDTSSFGKMKTISDEERELIKSFKRVFVNPIIRSEEGQEWSYKEGCLSIPEVYEQVLRKPKITISYLDENFSPHTDTFGGMIARVIQHEYDHLEGVLFTQRISSLKKRLIKGALDDISKGDIEVDFPMTFFKKKKTH